LITPEEKGMGLLKILFRAITGTQRPKRRRYRTFVNSQYQSEQFCLLPPITEFEKVRHQNDLDRIQALPIVRVGHIIDGDTVIVFSTAAEYKIRLDSIDCPENGQEWGDIATRGLIKLIGGKSVRLEAHGTDVHGRTLGTLFVNSQETGKWQNVNERMVTLGHAWVSRLNYIHLPKSRQQKLNQLERWAKSKKVGLWKTENPIPPWKWRKNGE
jgi:endonuclease YncB( thermonuclease family)